MAYEIRDSRESLNLMTKTQKAWDKSYPKKEGDNPNISYKVGFMMCLERTIKNKMSALQFDWEKWQPFHIGETPNNYFSEAYKMASEL